MLRPKFFFLPLLFLGVSSAWAHIPEEGKILATLGPILYRTHADPEPSSVGSPFLGGMALIAQGDVNRYGSLEIALFYLHKNYYREDGGLLQVEKAKRIYVTMGYRYWFTERISSALAFSSGHSMGDTKIIHSDFPSGYAADTTAGERTEYGFDFSTQWEIWAHKKFAVVSDARYYASVTNKDHEDANHYGLFLGLRYLVQEK